MQFIPYLGFNGNAREALEYYARTLGAKLEMTAYGDTPMGAAARSVDGERRHGGGG